MRFSDMHIVVVLALFASSVAEAAKATKSKAKRCSTDSECRTLLKERRQERRQAKPSASPMPQPNTYPACSGDFHYTGAVQTCQIESTGLYKLEVLGGSGGDGYDPSGNTNPLGGLAAFAAGTVELDAGTILTLVVGGQGSYASTGNGGSGGGGSFVYIDAGSATTSFPLVIAGGGGAGGAYAGSGVDASLNNNGTNNAADTAEGGYNGQGGMVYADSTDNGGAGAGFYGAGAPLNPANGAAAGGEGYNTFSGGQGAAPIVIQGAFGGGGGAGVAAGGGGGGYSGGAGGDSSAANGSEGGGGGGSFVTSKAADPSIVQAKVPGNGAIAITLY